MPLPTLRRPSGQPSGVRLESAARLAATARGFACRITSSRGRRGALQASDYRSPRADHWLILKSNLGGASGTILAR